MIDPIKLSSDALFSWTKALLSAAGLESSAASTVADIFLRSSLRGVGHHDISMLPQRLDWLMNHGVNPRPVLTKTGGRGSVEAWDGNQGLGEFCTSHICHRAIALAKEHGTGLANIKNSNHFLAAAPYAEIGTEAGMILLLWSNTDATMRYPGGEKPVIGNNPFGYGVPGGSGAPWILDICMAYASLGTLRAYANEGQTVPDYWGVDAQGKPCSDPHAILSGGSISPMGNHKGFGLALLGEVLTGILSSGTTLDQVSPGGGINTHNQAVLAIDPLAFGLDLTSAMASLEVRLKSAQEDFRFPGERSAKAALMQREEGIALSEQVFERLEEWSKRWKITIPERIS